ncbi:MAG: DUF4824 family protein [Pseudomonadota bacterium]
MKRLHAVLQRAGALPAALLLIVLTNAIALGGVAWNRSGTPGSELLLSPRELDMPYGTFDAPENSGVALRIVWRALDRRSETDESYRYFAYGSHTPDWLDAAKMRALGFTVPDTEDPLRLNDYAVRTQEKTVFLVLELDGPFYRESIMQAQRALDRTRRLQAAAPGDVALQAELKSAEEIVRSADKTYSRLFVVDAGRDAAALRAQYADRRHYAVVRGRIAPATRYVRQPGGIDRVLPGGYIAGLEVDRIHVPLGVLPAVAGERPPADAPYEMPVAWGKRFEPWITGPMQVRAPAGTQTRE